MYTLGVVVNICVCTRKEIGPSSFEEVEGIIIKTSLKTDCLCFVTEHRAAEETG